jgi:hypothetical protein
MIIEPSECGVSFESALAQQQGWDVRFAGRVTGEYRRFLYLAAIAGFEVTPSQTVDEAWHLHLTFPHYREILCNRILGRPLDHLPGTGTEEDDARCARQYEETLALYARVFATPAPRDIWPRPFLENQEEEDSQGPRGERARMFSRLVAFGSLAASLPALAFGSPALAAGLVGGAFLFILLGQPSTPAGRSGGGCGGGGCSAFGSSSDNCGASCGGSCGGGSCGGGGGGGGGGD